MEGKKIILHRKSGRKRLNEIHWSIWGRRRVGVLCRVAVNQHTQTQMTCTCMHNTADTHTPTNTLQACSWCESFRFARLAVSDLMTLHIFSSSSYNKNSLFCSCLDGGGGGGRNRDPIQRTDQHDRSLEQTLSPSSEWQLVKPQ